ncbi:MULTISPECIES: HlyD family type I secretion periplasmic adaptor subunit [unclassified Ruegeria]|uniref:HlyD family type I secretion periplasmic adaptor subunit n=1 Tax=unclassified Ruegeria TaxID=2625375 RepID=UPI0014910BC1|nr:MULTISPECIES: HlyD family type I secretion periplasmic adaptor subunit [unclassified Ruegeria]NOD88284.1 HlyD family type I secretion periplasmic adaptor subunit [Ruegeria sp. HKCCD4318]NOE13193.1 HlyD family type I secretion periplasmic adaptor subunit [Ruegeria sp. HKCCD4318-2]NOG11265.1 HlyD family type I secretion periplasmic adaptor subunit [Ruegeria sp. HKCCD4315]
MTRIVPYASNDTTPDLYSARVVDVTEATPGIRLYVLFGLFTLLAFVGGSIYWAFASRLDGAVVAPASFVVEGDRKTVEHLDGGIVRSILVADGEAVEQGQPLIRLDSTEIDVDLSVLGSQIGELSVRRARLIAQLQGQSQFDEAAALQNFEEDMNRLHWASAFLTQKQLFDAEHRARATEAEINAQRISALRDQIEGLNEQRISTQNQMSITLAELESLQTLLDKGLVAITRVSARQIEVERLSGVDASLRTQIAQAENQVSELKLTMISQKKLRDEVLAGELAVVDAQLDLLRPQFSGTVERRKRIEILAPVSGRVVNLTASTTGGVIRPGEHIMEIVPADQALIVEARVKPGDIDKLKIGQATRIRLSAFAQADVPEAQGAIVDISADALEDERTGEAYYKARVKLDDQQSKEVAALDLVPGMPADLFVTTGERSVIAYLAQPISERLARTFIE